MQEPVDYSRKWYVMAAVAMSIFLATIDGSIVNVAMPTLVQELHADFATVEWVILAYLLTLTTLMLGVGRLADMRGKKNIFTAGLVVFTIGSVLCGLAPTVLWLIAFRVLQAVGAAMALALGTAIITEAFPPRERGKAIGITGTLVSLGAITGPTLGGLIIASASWHWIFFVNLPVGILGTFVAIRFIPAHQPAGGQRFDFAGAVMLCISLLALLLALTLGQDFGFGDTRALALFAAFTLFTVAFIVVELRVKQPMIDLGLFKNGLFSINLITGFITFVAVSGAFLLMPFYLGNVLGYGAEQIGLMLTVVPIALGLSAPVSGWLSDRFGTRPITVIGLLVLLIAYLGLSTLTADTNPLGLVLRYLPLGLGMGIFSSPNNSAIMGAAPRERLGVASGLLSLTRTLGQVTGTALLGALWAANVIQRAGMTLPGGATTAPPSMQVAAQHDTFSGVVVLVGFGLALAIWALVQERRTGLAPAVVPRDEIVDLIE